jgi:hypothetical protein
MSKQDQITQLVKIFSQSVAAQTNAIQNGDHKVGNKHAKDYINAFLKLREFGDSGREALAELLNHHRGDVRILAAAYLLRYKTVEALRVLREESFGEGIVAFEAGEAIKRWEEGDWNLDPE